MNYKQYKSESRQAHVIAVLMTKRTLTVKMALTTLVGKRKISDLEDEENEGGVESILTRNIITFINAELSHLLNSLQPSKNSI